MDTLLRTLQDRASLPAGNSAGWYLQFQNNLAALVAGSASLGSTAPMLRSGISNIKSAHSRRSICVSSYEFNSTAKRLGDGFYEQRLVKSK